MIFYSEFNNILYITRGKYAIDPNYNYMTTIELNAPNWGRTHMVYNHHLRVLTPVDKIIGKDDYKLPIIFTPHSPASLFSLGKIDWYIIINQTNDFFHGIIIDSQDENSIGKDASFIMFEHIKDGYILDSKRILCISENKQKLIHV